VHLYKEGLEKATKTLRPPTAQIAGTGMVNVIIEKFLFHNVSVSISIQPYLV
jgi:hypothetical protein